MRPPPPAAPPPPPARAGRPGSARGCGVGPAGGPPGGWASCARPGPERERERTRWGRGRPGPAWGHRGAGSPAAGARWEVRILGRSRGPHGGGGRAAPGWVGPCPSPPPPAAAPGAAGLRADSSPGDPARAAAGCVRRGSAAVPLLRAPPASGAPGEADPLPPTPPHPRHRAGAGARTAPPSVRAGGGLAVGGGWAP